MYKCPDRHCNKGDTRIIVAIDMKNHYRRVTYCTACYNWFATYSYGKSISSDSAINPYLVVTKNRPPSQRTYMHIRSMMNRNNKFMKMSKLEQVNEHEPENEEETK